MIRTTIKLHLLALAFAAFVITPGFAFSTGPAKEPPPSFQDFSQPLHNGEGNALRGVYVSDVLALPVVQQPVDNPYYVSSHDGEVTQFSTASQYGNIGLLAHNNLAGRAFSRLSIGQEVELVYGDGKVEKFVITEVLHFQALQPQSQQSTFIN